MGRRRRSGLELGKTQDPGKDLFAYLFLLMMVFSLMFLMTMDERYQQEGASRGPEKVKPAPQDRSTLARVDRSRLGRLVKKKGEVYIAFGDQLYQPGRDLGLLDEEGRISRGHGAGGQGNRILYLTEDGGSRVLLAEYLQAFQELSREGITVAFAEVKQ